MQEASQEPQTPLESGMAHVVLWRRHPKEKAEPLASEVFYDFSRPIEWIGSSLELSSLDDLGY